MKKKYSTSRNFKWYHPERFKKAGWYDGNAAAKICTNCGVNKKLSFFSADKYKSDKLQCWCKECQKEDRRNNRTIGVYFIQSIIGGPIKIGMSTDVAKRVETIQTMNPTEILLLSVIHTVDSKEAYSVELELHNKFKRHRLHGEWFKPVNSLLKCIVKGR